MSSEGRVPASPEFAEALPLRISTAAIYDNDIQITFTTLEGKTYLVEHTDDVGKPDWQPAAQPVLGTGGPVTVTDPGGATHPIRFYRIRIVE